MRILLISPNTLTAPYPVYPIGLDYVAASVPDPHEVRVADLNLVSLEDLERLLASYAPEVIGLSCRNIDNTDADDPQCFIDGYRTLVSWLRRHSPALLVCGGSGFTIMPDRVFADLGVDFGVIGEGERFGLLVTALAEGRDPTTIAGVVSSAADCRPPQPWSGEPIRAFTADAGHLRFYLERGGMLNLQTKRGCSFHCIYCPYPRIEGGKHRLLPPEHVARTALELEAAGAKYLFLTDSAFNSDIDHSLAVAKAFRSAGLAIPWGGFFAPRKLPVGYFSTMAECGCRHAEFGTESLSAAMLKAYRKPFGVDDVLTAHNRALAAGLHVAHYFLLGGPGENQATVRESLDRIETLARTVLFFFIGIRIYPGTPLHELALAEGKITVATDLLEPVFYTADEISRQEIDALVRARAGGRINWVIGSGGGGDVTARMYARGFSGPLWEYLAR